MHTSEAYLKCDNPSGLNLVPQFISFTTTRESYCVACVCVCVSLCACVPVLRLENITAHSFHIQSVRPRVCVCANLKKSIHQSRALQLAGFRQLFTKLFEDIKSRQDNCALTCVQH